MERTLALETTQKIGQEVLLKGWVNRRRDHGEIVFFDLRDRSGIVQVVVRLGDFDLEAQSKINELRSEFAVEIGGAVSERTEKNVNADLETGRIEIKARSVKILSKAASLPFDMALEELNLELPTLLDHRTLTLRHLSQMNIFKIQEAVLGGFRRVAQELGCTEIIVPTISASATEGGAEVFKVNYYDHSAFLTQSPQLYKQMMVPIFERVFTVVKAYRAEPSVTTRHLAEVTQMDCEFGFMEFEELLDLLEKVASTMLKYAEVTNVNILRLAKVEPIAWGKIPRLKLAEAQEIIFKDFGRDVRREKDLSPQDEIDLCLWSKKNQGSDLVTITHFPTAKRAFYTMPDPNNPEVSLSYDILFRGLEIVSGSQRISSYEELLKVMDERGIDKNNFEMYLQAFKYGMPPEGGFSFGLERITMKMLDLKNIREASLFPRDMERVDFRLSKTD